MANLLPHEIQERIFSRTLLRAAVASSILLAIAAGLSLLALAPAYLTLETERSALAYQLASFSGNSSGNDSQAAVSATAKQLHTLDVLIGTPPSLTRAIDSLIAAKPHGLSLTAIAYAAGSGSSTPPTLTVSATGAQASSQSAYLAALRGVPMFQSVEVPIAALAHADAGALSIIIHGSF